MTIELNPDVLDTGTPPIPEAKAWLARYDGSHGPAIDLSQAVPGAPPPRLMLDALGRAGASAEAARYGAIIGDPALRTALANEMSALYGGVISADDIAITAGCNLAFVIAVAALARAGDNVILPVPWYFNHEMALRMLGIEARALSCDPGAGFIPSPDTAAALIDERTRAIVLVTPNNPTGAVYPPETIARFSDLAAKRGIALILDETYRDFLLLTHARPHTLFMEGTDEREHVVQLYSFSKAYAIPGHRLGALVAPRTMRGNIGKLLDTFQICAPRVAQIAVAETMAALVPHRDNERREIARRADVFRDGFSGLNGWRIHSIGAYFAYLEHPFAGHEGARVAERLAVERGVLALPGSYFGPDQERFLRVAFANARTEIVAAVPERLSGFSL